MFSTSPRKSRLPAGVSPVRVRFVAASVDSDPPEPIVDLGFRLVDHPPIALQDVGDERLVPSRRRTFLERLDRLVALGVLEDPLLEAPFAMPNEFGFDRDAEGVRTGRAGREVIAPIRPPASVVRRSRRRGRGGLRPADPLRRRRRPQRPLRTDARGRDRGSACRSPRIGSVHKERSTSDRPDIDGLLVELDAL